MKPEDVPNALRILADRFERLGITDDEVAPDGDKISVGFNLYVHRIADRATLAKVVSLMVNPRLDADKSAVVAHEWQRSTVRIVAFFSPGLLGGERREVFTDSQAGLDALVQESRAAAEVCA